MHGIYTKDKLVLSIICIMGTVIGFGNFFRISGRDNSGLVGYLHIWWYEMEGQGQKIFFLATNQTSNSARTPLTTALGIVTTLGYLHR